MTDYYGTENHMLFDTSRPDSAERDLVDEVSHYWKCCTCQKQCARVEHKEWPQMRVSKCCGGVTYRCEYTEGELVELLREAIDQEEVERAELLIHAAGRLRKEYRAERERRRA